MGIYEDQVLRELVFLMSCFFARENSECRVMLISSWIFSDEDSSQGQRSAQGASLALLIIPLIDSDSTIDFGSASIPPLFAQNCWNNIALVISWIGHIHIAFLLTMLLTFLASSNAIRSSPMR